MKNLEKYVESHDLRQSGSIFMGNSVEQVRLEHESWKNRYGKRQSNMRNCAEYKTKAPLREPYLVLVFQLVTGGKTSIPKSLMNVI